MQGSNGNGSGWKHTEHDLLADIPSQADTLPLRRDMVTLLESVRDSKVVGTQSTGNFPLKEIREVTAQFVEPPILDTNIGGHIYRLRTEADIWPLHYLHILAEVGNLVSVAPGRRRRLTEPGNEFLVATAFNHVVFLLAAWWGSVNWVVAYPYSGMGDVLPDFFEIQTLAQLRDCPVGEAIPFEEFADDLIETTGLKWSPPDDQSSPTPLHRSIQRMVIEIVGNFSVVETNYRYREEILRVGTLSRLDTFQITPLGEALLDALTVVYG